MRTLMLLSIVAIMTATMAKYGETMDTKVKNYIANEWSEIKEFQQASWQNGKEQNAQNWAKIKSFFSNLTGHNND